jgi:glucosamine--fructose-6-phosphate aminotransferase (isomerizing)
LKKPSVKTARKITDTKRPALSTKIAVERHVPGLHTLRETLSQPAMWAETFMQLDTAKTVDRLAAHFSAEQPWLFVACGSSYYLSQLVCSIWSRNFSFRCTAVPASEFLFAPEGILRSSGAKQIVFISRSGETTEVIRAAEVLKNRVDVRTLGVTCNATSRLDELCAHMSTLPWADEKSTVMTRSFTSILLFFQLLGDRISGGGNAQLSAALKELPAFAQPWLDANADRIRKFITKRKFADFVFLGQGAHYWLAQEAALKITEMSASYAQAYHSLEFRHGPRSIAGPQTLITFFLSDAADAEESLLVQELKALKAATLVVVNRATSQLKASGDLLIELSTSLPEFARFAVTAIPAHLLGTEVGLHKGLDPDAPKNLTRAVVLGAPQKNSHVALQLHSSGKMRANH